ncbi:MAG: HAMP domain-containing sensor histidine kinase [Candidatus Omnitrophota bacterium]
MSNFLLFADPLVNLILVFFVTIVIFIAYIMNKLQSISILKKRLDNLNQTIDELDEQAKLIIQSDMELKLSQQETEDKLNKLTLIRNLITSSIYTLSEENIFLLVNEKMINDLGFKKGLILNFNDLEIKVNIDFNPNELEIIKNMLRYKKERLQEILLLKPDSESCQQLLPGLNVNEILISPLKVREHIYAIFIVSGSLLHAEIQKPEEETFLITCMYLSQCFNNIELFEDLYHIKDNLEKKIKERTNELVKSLREIEAISKAKSDFISSVSHELRTPLTSVKGFSSLLVDEKFGKLPQDAKSRLAKIDENVDKLMDTVNTLLDISRIESGKMDIKIAPFELMKLIKDVADFLKPQIETKSLLLNFDIPKALNVYMDKNLIERALINLINNAIKFTSEKGKIEIACRQKDNNVIVSIADTGCGIKKEDLGKIFQEFYRTETAEKIKGSGLGLSLVKKIIDTHKGNIWVESEEQKGTTFYFTLKIAQWTN